MLQKELPDRRAARLLKQASAHRTLCLVRVGLLAALSHARVYTPRVLLLAVPVALFLSELVDGFIIVLPVSLFIAIAWIVFRTSPQSAAIAEGVELPPGCVELCRRDAPALFAEIDLLRSRLRSEPVHGVLITDQSRASVARLHTPRRFGGQRNNLVLGMPLMLALGPDEFRSVLAHEIAHLSNLHDRVPSWVDRASARWTRALKRMEQTDSVGTRLRSALVGWYLRRCAAAARALGRSDELWADCEAATITGVETTAAALKRLGILERYEEEYHVPAIGRLVDSDPEPPDDVLRRLFRGIRKGGGPWEAESWLLDAVLEAGDPLDSHPTLAQRLVAIGDPHPLRPPPWLEGADAATHYLGVHGARLMRYFGHRWRARAQAYWLDNHQRLRRLRQLEELDEKSALGTISLEEEWERAQVVSAVRGAEAALPILEHLLSSGLDGPDVRYLLGRLLLETGDPDGLSHIEAAMARKRSLVPSGCEIAIEYLQDAGPRERTTYFHRRLKEYQAETANACEERLPAAMSLSDTLLPHGLDDRSLEPIVATLDLYRSVRSAYLARKEVRFLPERPLYVLGVRITAPETHGEQPAARQQMIKWLARGIPFPGDAVVILMGGKHRGIGRMLKEVPGAEIYARKR